MHCTLLLLQAERNQIQIADLQRLWIFVKDSPFWPLIAPYQLVRVWTLFYPCVEPRKQTRVNTDDESTSGKETETGTAIKRLHSAVSVGLKTRSAGLIIHWLKVRVLPRPPTFQWLVAS